MVELTTDKGEEKDDPNSNPPLPEEGSDTEDDR
jgi:hypothetical protein